MKRSTTLLIWAVVCALLFFANIWLWAWVGHACPDWANMPAFFSGTGGCVLFGLLCVHCLLESDLAK